MRWLLQRAASLAHGEMQLERVQRRDGALVLQQLRYRDSSVEIEIAELTVVWQPWHLLSANLVFDRLYGRDVVVRLAAGEATEQAAGEFSFPLRLSLQDTRIEKLMIIQAGNARPLQFDSLTLRAAYTSQTLSIEAFTLNTADGDLSTSGQLTTRFPYPVSLLIVADYRLSQQDRLSGSTQLDGTLSQLKASGQLSISGGRASGMSSEWQAHYAGEHLRLPSIKVKQPNGTVGATLEADLNWQHGPLRYQLKGALLGGRVKSDGEVQHADGLKWHGEVTATSINPGVLWHEWPGMLNAAASFHGSYREEIALEVPKLKVDGQLRSHKLTLSSSLKLQDMAVKIEQLTANAGSASLSGHLAIDEQLQAELKLDAPDMAELWPGAAGHVKAQLKASGSRHQPRLRTQFEGSSLRLDGYAMSTLKGSIDVDLSGSKPWDVTVDGSGIVPGFDVASPITASLRAEGSASAHRLRLNAEDNKRTLTASANGRWQQSQWQGELTILELLGPYLGHWQLKTPARVTLSADEIILENSCLTSLPATACLAYRQEKTATQQLQLSLNQFELSRFNHLSEAYATLSLPLDAEVALTLAQNSPPSGHARITVGSGSITPAAEIATRKSPPIKVKGGSLLATAGGGTIETDADFTLISGDQLLAGVMLQLGDDWRTRPLHQPLQATLNSTLSELQFLSPFIPELDEIHGNLKTELRVGGSIAAPLLTGEARLLMTEGQLPRLGLILRDVAVIAKSEKPGHLDISAHLSSGKGQLRAEGWFSATGGKNWHSEVTLQGEQLEVSNIPEAQVSVSPSLQLQASPQQLKISGEVTIDAARLEPRELTLATTPSKDVVIVTPQERIKAPPRWLVSSDVRLHAADSIFLKGFGFTGYLGGNVRLIDEPTKTPRAQGELRLVPGASYRAFGQDLKAEYGRLYYADTPIDNPGLDIKAARKVGDVVAGIKVEGTAQQPQITLFSRPAMDQTDILSCLTLGRPFSLAGTNDGNTLMQAANSVGLAGGDYLLDKIGSRFNLDEARLESSSKSGEPWLVVGRYLSPRLYVRYGVGLMESGSSLIMRYQLSESWSLQGEGGSATGADLLYSIERP